LGLELFQKNFTLSIQKCHDRFYYFLSFRFSRKAGVSSRGPVAVLSVACGWGFPSNCVAFLRGSAPGPWVEGLGARSGCSLRSLTEALSSTGSDGEVLVIRCSCAW